MKGKTEQVFLPDRISREFTPDELKNLAAAGENLRFTFNGYEGKSALISLFIKKDGNAEGKRKKENIVDDDDEDEEVVPQKKKRKM